MWRKTRLLLVILSVSLNAAFLGVWAMRTVPKPVHPAKMVCGQDSTCKVWCPLHRALGTTDAQWSELEPRQREFLNQSQTMCGRVNRLRTEMIDLMAQPDANRDSIRAIQEEIISAQRSMQDLIVNQLLAEKQVLNAEQRAKLFAMMRETGGCAARGSMMGTSPGCRMKENQPDSKQ
jgi:Spy/CpxP family protein refolding chaperone